MKGVCVLGMLENHSFWIAQGFALIAVFIIYARTQQTDRRQFNLYHTYLCIPLMAQYFLLDAWFMFSLCLVGAIRTLLLSTGWGWGYRKAVVGVCLIIPVVGSIYTATHWADWFLLIATIVGVGADAVRSFTHLRIAVSFCSLAWMLNSFVFGGYISAFANLVSLIGFGKILNREFGAILRFRAFLGCQKSKQAYLQGYGCSSY